VYEEADKPTVGTPVFVEALVVVVDSTVTVFSTLTT
jgi:hypothetical protein